MLFDALIGPGDLSFLAGSVPFDGVRLTSASYAGRSSPSRPSCSPEQGLLARLAFGWPLGTWILGEFAPLAE